MNTIDVFQWGLWNRNTTTGRVVILIDRFVIVGRQSSLGEDFTYKLTNLDSAKGARAFAIGATHGAETDGYELVKGPLRWVRDVPDWVDLWTWLSTLSHKDVSDLYGNGLRLGTELVTA